MPFTRDGLPWAPQSETSRDAAVSAERFVGQQGDRVAEWFEARGAVGATQKEASELLGIGRPSIAARVNALASNTVGRLVKTTVRRGGCAVYVAPLHLEAFQRRHGSNEPT